jgi:hypothetical protein
VRLPRPEPTWWRVWFLGVLVALLAAFLLGGCASVRVPEPSPWFDCEWARYRDVQERLRAVPGGGSWYKMLCEYDPSELAARRRRASAGE